MNSKLTNMPEIPGSVMTGRLAYGRGRLGLFYSKEEGMTMEEGRKVVKEQTKDGGTIYRYSDFDKKIEDGDMITGELKWCFTLIMERFKVFLDALSTGDAETDVGIGIILSPMIKSAEKELDDIADLIFDTVGDIRLLYKEDLRYQNFIDRSVAGLVFHPAGKKEGKKAQLNEAA
jgi:hypothetical protein